MRDNFLPFSPPLIGEEEIAEVVETLRSDWITTGPKVRRFEQEFAEAIGAQAALAVSSCTAAMHLALAALGVGPGNAVIASPMTFCSGVHVIEQVGALPVLVDVEPDTLNLDPAKVAESIEKVQAAEALLKSCECAIYRARFISFRSICTPTTGINMVTLLRLSPLLTASISA